jgi:hypothetical protein
VLPPYPLLSLTSPTSCNSQYHLECSHVLSIMFGQREATRISVLVSHNADWLVSLMWRWRGLLRPHQAFHRDLSAIGYDFNTLSMSSFVPWLTPIVHTLLGIFLTVTSLSSRIFRVYWFP